MSNTPSAEPNMLDPQPKPHSSKKRIIIISTIVVLITAILGAGAAYGRSFSGRVLPGVHIGSFEIGGMTEEQLAKFIEGMYSKLTTQGIPVTFKTTTSTGTFVLPLQTISEESVYDFIEVDTPNVTHELISRNKTGNIG